MVRNGLNAPPHDLETERCVLGCIMVDPDSNDLIQPIIGTPSVMYSERHRLILSTLRAMRSEGDDIDVVTLRDALERRGLLSQSGGSDYLLQILETVPHAAHAEHYARIVREKYDLRRMAEFGNEMVRKSHLPGANAVEIIAETETAVRALNESRSTQEKFPAISLGELLSKEFPPSQWIAEGFIREHETCFWIAPPKTLKTTLILALAVAAASGKSFLNRFPCHEPKQVLALLGETPEESAMLMLRRACEAAGVDPSTIADSIHIHCGALPHVTNDSDLTELSKLCQKHRADLVILDPFYLMAEGVELSRLEVVGPRIRAIGDAVKPGTLVVAHHTTKGESKQIGKVLDMGSGTGTGSQAACGQWVIQNREEEFDPQSSDWHVLNMTWGGRGGHGGRLLVRYRESTGEVETELMGSLDNQVAEREKEQEARKIAALETRMNSARNVISGILRRSDVPMSGRDIESALRLSASDWVAIGQTLCRGAISNMKNDLTLLACQHRVNGKLRDGFVLRDDRQRFSKVPGLSFLDPDPTIGGAS